jgi:transposase
MRRKVKYFKRKKKGKTYYYPWVGYSFRNKNGNPDFKREINLSGLSEEEVAAVDMALRCVGRSASGPAEVQFLDSVSIGAQWAAFRIAEDLGIVAELRRLDKKHRDAVLCMVLDRVVNPKPYSKAALYRALPGSALERVVMSGNCELKLHDFYIALEKLHEAQPAIQRGLFKARRKPERMFLYDITSSYVEGEHCPLAAFGYNRDGKKGKMQIVIGLLTDAEGLPVAVEVFEGNTSDQTTVMGQIEKLRREFGIEEMVFIGDRGMLTSARREDLQSEEYERIKYISALTRSEMFAFLEDQDHPLQMGLFDRQNLVEIGYEGVRYVLCFNPEKEAEDRQTRLRLIERTEEKLEMIRRNVEAGNWRKRDVIAARLYRWINHWGMQRFFNVEYDEDSFSYERDEEAVRAYEAVDGCYVILSDTPAEEIPTAEVRERYKSLAQVEQAFRTMKNTELYVRPLRHWNPERVKGHVFVCMLAYMIVWKARRLFRPFMTDEGEADTRNPGVSLRSVWEKLAEAKIGLLKIGKKTVEQLKPLSAETKSMLKAASASLTAKAKERLALVG